MKGKTLKYVILLATISVAGIFLIQFVFIKNSYNYSEKQFRESAVVALKEVAYQILLAGGNSSNFDSITPVEIISNNTYLVNVGEVIDADLLKVHLIEELKKHEIFADFEYAIYDPVTEQMEDATLISNNAEMLSYFEFPVNPEYTNYFAVHFPNRTNFFISQLSIWYFLTGLLAVVVLFFGYTLSVIIRQRQLSEIQKNFINNLTHELKTPISSIAISASVIANEEILKNPKRLFEYARIIQEQNQRLSKNVEKVLNLASLEKNRLHLNLEEFGLKEILSETIQQFKQTDSGQKTEIISNFNIKERVIIADKFHFTNLALNILENGVKYCDKKSQLIVELLEEKKTTEIRFIDNGIGIPKDQRKKIFTKFYRIPTGNVHNVKGFGLGLDYVKKIVVAHKWEIRVDENPRGGSIFTLIIPNKNG
ncbi:MAG: HAMP domain-containing sensor histidine kinase [Draconibacterium sp.]